MQQRQRPLRGEEAVGDHPDEERRDHRRQGGGAIRETDLCPRELERLAQIGAHGYKPCAPDEVLEEHHGRELEANDGHGAKMRPIAPID
jgi:hypothetical protein